MPPKTTGTHTAKSIQNVAERLRVIASGLDAIAKTLESLEPEGVDTIEVDRQRSLIDGLGFLSNWRQACEDAVTMAMNNLGMFGTDKPSPDQANATTPAKGKRRRKSP